MRVRNTYLRMRMPAMLTSATENLVKVRVRYGVPILIDN